MRPLIDSTSGFGNPPCSGRRSYRAILLERLAKLNPLEKSLARSFMRLNRRIWRMIPPGLRDSSPVLSYGEGLHWLVRLLDKRQQYYGTFFLRNRPALELMRRIAVPKAERATLRIAVLACSSGAEVYSILWTIRSARPDLKVVVRAVDISEEIVDVARRGVYVPDASGLVGSTIFERMTAHEMDQMFDREGEAASIKPWLREGITWQVGDASSPELIHDLGRQDIVVASNFLCHMDPPAAETCLRNIAGLVDRDGSLFVSGVDLAVRTKVAQELCWRLVPELREQIHDGDPKLREGWPLCWWGLEPLDRRRKDWQLRYTAVFQIPDHEPQ